MFQKQTKPHAPGGGEYGIQPGYGYQPEPLAPSARPVLQGYGQSPAQAVEQQLSGLIDASQAPPPVENPEGEFEVLLSKPYKAHDLEIRRVQFREPTGLEYRKIGNPTRYVVTHGAISESALVVNVDVVAQYIAALSSPPVPMSTVDKFSVEDINACSRVICDFFL